MHRPLTEELLPDDPRLRDVDPPRAVRIALDENDELDDEEWDDEDWDEDDWDEEWEGYEDDDWDDEEWEAW